ncbi:MAG TPA: hypothetical protein VFY29_05555 [Terriglobia bacterium]|nr:hypothetical protein [Terriglobia bacterium]
MSTLLIPKRAASKRAGMAVLVAVLVMALAGFSHVFALQGGKDVTPDHAEANSAYEIGLWGDLPYSDVQSNVGVPNLIADMNSQKLAFSVHDGDLKQGSNSPCNDALYINSINYLNSLQAPAMFTPGDNDWTDCDRANNGGYNSRERLTHERIVMFGSPYSFGQRFLLQEVQTAPLCIGVNGYEGCVENRRWTYGRVTYATLNVQGSCNNLCDTAPDSVEFAARNAANIAWLNETFAQAVARNSVAIMLITQADPGFDLSDAARAPLRDPKTLVETDGQPDGFKDYLVALRELTIAFKKPVAYVHGDSHYFRIDRPFQDALGRRLENFTRVETFGDNAPNGNNDVQWLKVMVDPKSREVFAYQAQIVPGNRVAVPAP